MVVNLSEARLREFIIPNNIDIEGDFFLIDRTGMYLSHPDNSYFATSPVPGDISSRVLDTGQKEGTLLWNNGHSSTLVSFATQPELGWIFIFTTDYSNVLSRLENVRHTT